MEVITRHGYENSRMDDVVKSSNMSKGAIYWYYKSKKDLYLDLVNYWVMRYSDMVSKIIEKELMKVVDKNSWTIFAHLLIDHGRKVCIANRPKCNECILFDLCPSSI